MRRSSDGSLQHRNRIDDAGLPHVNDSGGARVKTTASGCGLDLIENGRRFMSGVGGDDAQGFFKGIGQHRRAQGLLRPATGAAQAAGAGCQAAAATGHHAIAHGGL